MSASTSPRPVRHDPGPLPWIRPFGEELHELAHAAIDQGLAGEGPSEPDPHRYPSPLREPGAALVTLRLGGHLRGCLGSTEAHRPLVHEVANNAYRAAFRDPRYPPLTPAERPELTLGIEVLGPAETLPVASEAELLEWLQPGRDGLILSYGDRAGTFLPTVWQHLPEPEHFLAELKRKAGLPADFFSPEIQVRRFRTESLP